MNVLRTKWAGITVAVVLAALGTAVLVGFVNGAEHRALAGDKPTRVLVLTSAIAKGTPAEDLAGKVKSEQVPSKVKAAGAVSSLAALAGKVAAIDLVAGEQVVLTRFVTPAQASSSLVPAGLLQVTIAIDAVRADGGALKPGDTVGVLASFDGDNPTTHMILQKVPVTDVRSADGTAVKVRANGSDSVLTGTVLVTLALDAGSVERVVFAAEHGKVWLSSEPADANGAGTKVQTLGTVNG